MRHLFTALFWRAAALTVLRTFLAASVPFVPGLLADLAATWQMWLLTTGVTVVLAIANALRGIPSLTDAPWWEVALQRGLRQFGQFLAAGLAGAALLTDVDWRSLLLSAAASALSTLVLAAIDVLPAAAEDTGVSGSSVDTGVGSGAATVLSDEERAAVTELRAVLADSAAAIGDVDPVVPVLDRILTG